MKLERTLEQYRNGKPEIIVEGSKAQCFYALQDARKDVLTMAAFIERIARLNPDVGEIGPGMLASLVDDARQLIGYKP